MRGKFCMRLCSYSFLMFQISFSCLAFEHEFSEICSKDTDPHDCLDYEQRGLAYVICRWWYFFPSLRELDLLTERNPIYNYSLSYCDAWIKSEPSTLIPDIEGNFCEDDEEPADPKILLKNEPERAFLCAKHLQAENYFRAKASYMLSQIKKDFSKDALGIFEDLKNYFTQNKQNIEKQYKDIFTLDFAFPSKPAFNLWTKIAIIFWPVL